MSTKSLLKHLTMKQMRYFAVIGLDVHLNGMSLEDRVATEQAIKSSEPLPDTMKGLLAEALVILEAQPMPPINLILRMKAIIK